MKRGRRGHRGDPAGAARRDASARRILSGAAMALACGLPVAVQAQDAGPDPAPAFPEKTIRLIVPTAPGGGNDIMGRYVASRLGERYARQVIVDNRPGAAGLIGSQLTAAAAPDGHTLLMASTAFSMVAAVQKVPFDPVKSFTPISLVSVSPSALSVSPSLPVGSIADLVKLAKARPGELRYASAGTGSFNHFSGELFKLATGTEIVHVPYKGGPPGIVDVIAGHVEVLSSTLPAALVHMRAGKLKGLGVGSLRRSPAIPALPSISETLPGYESVIWWGVLAPEGVPAPVVAKLNGTLRAILGHADAAKYFESQAAEPTVATPEGFRKLIVADLAKWAQVAKAKGLTLE